MPNGPIFSHAEIAYCRRITCILAKLMKDCVVQHHHFDPYLENLWSQNPVEVKHFFDKSYNNNFLIEVFVAARSKISLL